MTTVGKSGFRLGVTGGIGSGKTSVCRVFSVLGIPVFSADREAQYIMENDKDIMRKINSLAGQDLYPGGSLNRTELAKIIFNDRALLNKVNMLVHPAVFERFRKWVPDQSSPYTIMEAAILFESGASRFVDRIVTVVAPIEERIKRVIMRNKLTREQVKERMKNQMDDEGRRKLSDFIIYNSENEMIIPAILNIHNEILELINIQS